MNKIVLTTDSGMDSRDELKMPIIPDQITDNKGNAYRDDGISITTKDILKERANYRTAAPLLTDYKKIFKENLDKGYDVIHLSLSHGLSSSSINNANMIALELNDIYKNNKVYILDSMTGATGGCIFCEYAYKKLLESNLNTNELIKELEKLRKLLTVAYYVPDPTGFISSGRDNSTKYDFSKKVLSLSSSILNKFSMKYRVDFHNNGDLYLKNIFRATKEKGMLKMTKEIVNEETIEDFDDYACVIGNLNQKDINIKEIKKYLESFKYFKNVYEKPVGNLIAPYGCNDLCGIALVKKNNNYL